MRSLPLCRIAITICAVLLAGIFGGKSVQAQLRKESRVGEWEVFVDEVQTCHGRRTWPDGGYMGIGLEGENRFVLMIGHRRWLSIKNNQTYDITLHMAPDAPLRMTARGGRDETLANDRPMLMVWHESSGLLDRLGRAAALEIEYRGEIIAGYSLSSSAALIKALRECQRNGGKLPPFTSTMPKPNAAQSVQPPIAMPPNARADAAAAAVGAWNIARDDRGVSCRTTVHHRPANGTAEDTVFVLLSFNYRSDAFSFIVGKPSWGLKANELYRLSLSFDGKPQATDFLSHVR